jgi:hypothetical protein
MIILDTSKRYCMVSKWLLGLLKVESYLVCEEQICLHTVKHEPERRLWMANGCATTVFYFENHVSII